MFKSNLFAKYLSYKIAFLLIFIISVFISLLFWFFSLRYYDNLTKELFEHRVNENIDNMQQRISNYKYALISGVALVNANDKITSQIWHDFISSLDLENNYPGFQGIGYSPVLKTADIPSFVKEIQIHNPNYNLLLSKEREIYVPVQYIEPMNNRNIKAIGYDLYSEATRRAVLDSARDSGMPSLSDKVILRQEIDSDVQAGILMYLPVYKKNSINSIEDRKDSIVGFVSGVFRMGDLMQNIVLKETILDFEIFDNKKQLEENLLFKSFTETNLNSKYTSKNEIKINDKIWYVNFYSNKEFENSFSYAKPLMLTLFGIGLYFVLLLIILLNFRT